MGAVHEDLGLHDGHQAVLLANAGVAGQGLHVLLDGQLRGSAAVRDADHAAPLGKACAHGVVLCAPRAKVSDALGHRLAIGAGNGLHSLVHLQSKQRGERVG